MLANSGFFLQINIIDDTQLKVTTYGGFGKIYSETFKTVSPLYPMYSLRVANVHKVDKFIYKHLRLIMDYK